MEFPSLAFDFGSSLSKIGVIGNDGPSFVFPTQINKFYFGKESYIGKEDEDNQCDFYSFPIEKKKVKNWTDFERICEYSFKYLEVDPTNYPVMLSESPLNSKEDRKRTTEIMFEKFETPLFYLENQCVLSLYAHGSMSGFILDIGEQVTHLAPIYEGTTLKHATIEKEIGGNDLTEKMSKLINKKHSIMDRNIIKELKKLSFVALDYQMALKDGGQDQSLEKSFELPDGNIITMMEERFQAGEVFFGSNGIDRMIEKSIEKLDLELWDNSYIGFAGLSNIPGMAERFLKESRNQNLPFDLKEFPVQPPSKEFSAWIGASIFGSILPIERWISMQQYNEIGPDQVNRMCF